MTLSSVISFLAIVGCVLAVDSDLNLCYHVERLLKSGVDPNQVVAALEASSKVPAGLFRNLATSLNRQANTDPGSYDYGQYDIVAYGVKAKNGKNSATTLHNLIGTSGSTINGGPFQLQVQASSVYKNSNVGENATVMEMVSPSTAALKKSLIKNRNAPQSKSALSTSNRSKSGICEEMLTRGISKDKLVVELLKTIPHRDTELKPSSSFQRPNVTRDDSKEDDSYTYGPGDNTVVTAIKNGKGSVYDDTLVSTNGVATASVQNTNFKVQSGLGYKESASSNVAAVTTVTTTPNANIPGF